MYTTNYSVTIKSISVAYVPLELTGDAAQAAIAQMTSHRDVDIVYEEDGQKQGMIIPYHDIDSAIIEETRTESEYTDDNAKNCVIPDSGETGDFTITNSTDNRVDIPVFASAALNGQYGDANFSTDNGDDPFPDGYQSFAMISVPAGYVGGSVVIQGVPVGTTFAYPSGDEIVVMGTAPGSYTIEAQHH